MIRSRDIDNRRFVFTKIQCIILLLHYFVGYSWLYPILVVQFDKAFLKTEGGIHPKLYTSFMILMILSFAWIVKEPLKRSFRFFKVNLKENFKSVFQNFWLLLGVNFLISLVMVLVFKIETQSENQTLVTDMIKMAPVPMMLSTMIFAPLVEELIFRGVLYQNWRSKKAYLLPMITSIVIFSSMHLMAGLGAGNGWFELIYIFQYAGLSFFMIRTMEQTNNIVGAMLIHFINNTLAFTTVFLFVTVLI